MCMRPLFDKSLKILLLESTEMKNFLPIQFHPAQQNSAVLPGKVRIYQARLMPKIHTYNFNYVKKTQISFSSKTQI